jgi:hypothetical protein
MAVCVTSPERQSLFDTKRNACPGDFENLSEVSQTILPPSFSALSFPLLISAKKTNLSTIKKEIVFFFSCSEIRTKKSATLSS